MTSPPPPNLDPVTCPSYYCRAPIPVTELSCLACGEKFPWNPLHLRLVLWYSKGDRRRLERWRKLWPAGVLNLEGADLRSATLEGADLLRATLEGADLLRATLEGANLGGANLKGAHLFGANLEGAYLFRANLEGAHLFRANLKGAGLGGANLKGAGLEDATLEGAKLVATVLDGETLLWNCKINTDTDFTGAPLDAARIEPKLK
ncbi:MAG: pentapeptide repeat-containing protein, partial [Pirellulaceae bacterium]|nr:pentapeptide repeat-containing protein [Pirellulaceae bacterium]